MDIRKRDVFIRLDNIAKIVETLTEIKTQEDTLKNLRNYGFSTIKIDNKIIILSCEELIKNYEDFEHSLLKSGLSPEEVSKHIKELNKKTRRIKWKIKKTRNFLIFHF